jgi:hypothetical protein
MIVDAMKENRVIAFEYKGYFDDDYKTRFELYECINGYG